MYFEFHPVTREGDEPAFDGMISFKLDERFSKIDILMLRERDFIDVIQRRILNIDLTHVSSGVNYKKFVDIYKARECKGLVAELTRWLIERSTETCEQ